MKNSSIKLLATAAILSTPMLYSAVAEEKQGFYTTLSTGISYSKESTKNLIFPVLSGISFPNAVVDRGQPSINIDNDSGLKLEGGIGYDFGKSRIEVTYDQSKSKMSTLTIPAIFPNGQDQSTGLSGGKRTTQSLMVSGFYDFDTDSKFTPYIGGGLGVAFIDTDPWTFASEGAGDSETQEVSVAPFEFPSTEQQLFSWQLQAGVAYEVNEQVDLTADLTYKDTSDFNIGIMSVQPSALISVEAGLRYYF